VPLELSLPQGLKTTIAAGSITIVWDGSTTAQTYTLYWNTTGLVSTADNSEEISSGETFVHNGVNIGTTYYYALTETAAAGTSELSIEVPVLYDIPAAPQGISAKGGDKQTTISWQSVAGSSSY